MEAETQRRDAEACLLDLFDDVDRGRHDRLAEYFTREAEFRFALSRKAAADGDYVRIRGVQAIADYLRASFSNLGATHHAITNLQTRIDAGTATSKAHMRVYHQGAGAMAHLFEESLSICDVTYGIEDGSVRITCFDYVVLIILGTTDIFTIPKGA